MGNRTPPLVMGHEFAGEIVAAGSGAEQWVGRRAAVNPFEGCGHCALCRAGHEKICPERMLIGVHKDGAFADLVRAPAGNLRALPDASTSASARWPSRWPTASMPFGSARPASSRAPPR